MISTPSSRTSVCYHGHWFRAKLSHWLEGDNYEQWSHIIIELLHALSFVVFLKMFPFVLIGRIVLSELWNLTREVATNLSPVQCEGSHARLVALNGDYCFALPTGFSKIISKPNISRMKKVLISLIWLSIYISWDPRPEMWELTQSHCENVTLAPLRVKITLFVCCSKSSISKNRLRMLRNKIKKSSPLCSVLTPAQCSGSGVFCIMCIPVPALVRSRERSGEKTQNKTNSNLNHRYTYWLTKNSPQSS